MMFVCACSVSVLLKLTIPFRFLIGEQHAADGWAFHGEIRRVKRSSHSVSNPLGQEGGRGKVLQR